MSELSEVWRSDLAVLLGGCAYDEDVDDASMCRCGLPALGHDESVALTWARERPEVFALVERLVTEKVAEAKAVSQETIETLRSAYREAIGVPESHHQRERMEQLATELEKALGRIAEAEAEGAREVRERVTRAFYGLKPSDGNEFSADAKAMFVAVRAALAGEATDG